ncbi:nucleoside 2-deoxyribosyltransferase [Variovorax guangxiensis]|uniref:nucleoside 2-deoxyribosyltransferase n=1 Tax=Variovorax guangxiensis TaxID=1775474 RepID=UPI00288A9FBC|nr:nucleoside 2-deoxyribosyltransferase [Variovorax guangxiensis]
MPPNTSPRSRLHATCLGLQEMAPSDGLVPVDIPEAEIAQRIFEINMGLLQRADGVIANLAPFRGIEPDSGTVFGVGVAVARGRASGRTRLAVWQLCRPSDGRHAHEQRARRRSPRY